VNADSQKTIIQGKLPAQIANLGGYQAPIKGNVVRGVLGGARAESAGIKREREDKKDLATEVTEKEEQRQREEARRRVQARTASAFGLE
jgi:hypothetical protein